MKLPEKPLPHRHTDGMVNNLWKFCLSLHDYPEEREGEKRECPYKHVERTIVDLTQPPIWSATPPVVEPAHTCSPSSGWCNSGHKDGMSGKSASCPMMVHAQTGCPRDCPYYKSPTPIVEKNERIKILTLPTKYEKNSSSDIDRTTTDSSSNIYHWAVY